MIAGLREETERVLAECNGCFTKAGLAKLVRPDSAIKESMRISAVAGAEIARRVRSASGITLDNGIQLPQAITVGVDQMSIHTDETFYDRPHEYDAFRFSRPQEDANLNEKQTNAGVNGSQNLQSMVSITGT